MSSWFKKWLILIGGLITLFVLAGFFKPDPDLALASILLSLFVLVIYFVIDLTSLVLGWLMKVFKYKWVFYTLSKQKNS